MGDFSGTFLSKSRVKRAEPKRREFRKLMRAPRSISVPTPISVPMPMRTPTSTRTPTFTSIPALAPSVTSPDQAVKQAQVIYIERVINQKSPPVVSEVKTYMTSPVVWIGEDYNNLFARGSLYNLNCQWFTNADLSSVRHAKCLIVSCTEITGKALSLVNFACEYGIPSIWLHRYLPPEVCFWSFTKRIHVEDSDSFWREICQIIE